MSVSEEESTVKGASIPPDIPMKTEGLLPKWRPSIAKVGFVVFRPLATALVIVNWLAEFAELPFCDSAVAEQKRVRQTKSTNAIHEVFLTMGALLGRFTQAGIFRNPRLF